MKRNPSAYLTVISLLTFGGVALALQPGMISKAISHLAFGATLPDPFVSA